MISFAIQLQTMFYMFILNFCILVVCCDLDLMSLTKVKITSLKYSFYPKRPAGVITVKHSYSKKSLKELTFTMMSISLFQSYNF